MRQREYTPACLQCGEEITYGDEVYVTEEGDIIDACCLTDWVEENYETLGFRRIVYQPEEYDPFAGY